MCNVAGGQAALDLYVIEVFDAGTCVTDGPCRDIAAGVRQGLAPRVVDVEQKSTGQALSQSGLPGVVIRLLGIVPVSARDVVRVGAKSCNTVDVVKRPDQVELEASCSDESGLKDHPARQSPLDPQGVIHCIGWLQIGIETRCNLRLSRGVLGNDDRSDVLPIGRILQAGGGCFCSGERASALVRRRCGAPQSIVRLEIHTEAAAYDEVALAVSRVGEAKTRCDAQIVPVVWTVRIALRTPEEIRGIVQSIQVVNGHGKFPNEIFEHLRLHVVRFESSAEIPLPTRGNIGAVAVVAHSQVQDQFRVHAPVVLREEPEVDHAPRERVLLGLGTDGGRLVPHDILEGLERYERGSRIRSSSPRHTEDAAELPAMPSAEHRELLLKRVAGYRSLQTILSIKSRHTRKRDHRKPALAWK